jgi:putative thioredoxin
MSAVPAPWLIDVEQDQFEREVLQRSHDVPVVVDFWAPWCGPCRALGPVLEKLANEFKGAFVLAKINIDRAPDLAAHYAVEAIPAVKAFRDGQPILGFMGDLPEEQLRAFLNRVFPSEADRLGKQAAALETNDPTAAEALYRQALQLERQHDSSLIGLARLCIARGQDDEAADLLTNTGPGSAQAAEVERLNGLLQLRKLAHGFADEASLRRKLTQEPDNAKALFELGSVLAAAGRHAEALDCLLAAAERDRKLASSKVREVMVQIFHIIGVRSETADTYRDKLSKLLY